MKQSISIYQFRDAFQSVRPDNFSYEGLGVLFESLEQLGEDTGTEVELDVIALCCEFSESTVSEIAANYGIDLTDSEDDDEIKDKVIDYLQDHTYMVGQVDDMGKDTTVVYQDF